MGHHRCFAYLTGTNDLSYRIKMFKSKTKNVQLLAVRLYYVKKMCKITKK